MQTVYFEISPLFERNFSGIPNVAKEFAKRFMEDAEVDVRFFMNFMAVPASFVRQAIEDSSGVRLAECVSSLPLKQINPEPGSVGFFPNFKSVRGVFSKEAFVVHDLSTITTPQFHSKETIHHHRSSLFRDIETSEVVFAVSQATLDDLFLYFPNVRKKKTVICKPAAVITDFKITAFREKRLIVTVLGTLEPRKNIGQVLEFIAENPEVAREFTFVIPGRFGWGESMHRVIERLGLQGFVADGIIQFPGYISDEAKVDLIRQSTLLVYPSVFEGFGMPVKEGNFCGVPVLTTRSSSITEVAQDNVFYFSPFKEGDFKKQFVNAVFSLSLESEKEALPAADPQWDVSYGILKSALLS